MCVYPQTAALPLSVAVQLGQFHRSLENFVFIQTTNKLLNKVKKQTVLFINIPLLIGSLVKDNPSFIWNRTMDVVSGHVQSTYGHLLHVCATNINR